MSFGVWVDRINLSTKRIVAPRMLPPPIGMAYLKLFAKDLIDGVFIGKTCFKIEE